MKNNVLSLFESTQGEADKKQEKKLISTRLQLSYANEGGMLAASPQMLLIIEEARRIAPLDLPVIITGETGVGKEMLARFIHQNSGRKGEFKAMNSAGLPETLVDSMLFGHSRGSFTGAIENQLGYFQLAQGGTLFLDEIGDMNKGIQAKILRVADSKGEFYPLGLKKEIKADCRLISATNRPLESLKNEEKFRQDLFFRLCVVHINIPPLRERREDILVLAQNFLIEACSAFNKKLAFSEKALQLFCQYTWPGNIRELKNAIERAVALCQGQLLDSKDFRLDNEILEKARSFMTDEKTLDYRKKEIILETLESCNGIIIEAAKKLNITTRTIYRFLQEVNSASIKMLQGSRENILNDEKQSIWLEAIVSYRGNIVKAAKKLGIEWRNIYRVVEKTLKDTHKKQTDSQKKERPAKVKREVDKEIMLLPPQDLSQEKNKIKDGLSSPMPKIKRHFTKETFLKALEENKWSQKQTARAIKTDPSHVCLLAKKWKIVPPDGSWGLRIEEKKETEKNEEFQVGKIEESQPLDTDQKPVAETAECSEEKLALIEVLEANNWNKRKSAAILKFSGWKINDRIIKFGIKPPSGKWAWKQDYTKEKLEEILKESNWNQSKAADKLKITQARLSFLAKNRGVVAPDGIWQKKEPKTGRITKEALIAVFEKNGWSQTEAAIELGICRSSVSYLCTTRGIVPPSGSWRSRSKKEHPTKEALIAFFEKKGWNQKLAAVEFGIYPYTVSSLCKAQGIVPPSGSWRSRFKKPRWLEIIEIVTDKPWPPGNEQKT